MALLTTPFGTKPIDNSAANPQEAWAKNQVETLYKDVLGRDSDAAGKNYWVNEYLSGRINFDGIQNSFLNSAENLQQHKGDAKGLLNEAYQVKLGRDADAGGLDHYSNLDFNTSLNDISQSDERQSYLKGTSTAPLYQNVLGREADADGLQYWNGQAMTTADKGMQFLASDEYRNKGAQEWQADKQAAAGQADRWGAGYTPEADGSAISFSGTDQTAPSAAEMYAKQYGSELNGLTPQEHWQQIGQFKGYDWGVNLPEIQQPVATIKPAGAEYKSETNSQVNAAQETIEGRLPNLLDANNPVVRQAADQARMAFAQRGLVNSSMAEQAAMEAMISKAIDIAGPDAQKYFQNRLNNVDWQNRFAQDYQRQTYTLQNMALQHQYNKELAKLNQSMGTESQTQGQTFTLRQNYLQAVSQANAIYQNNVASIQGSQMEQAAKSQALASAKTLRDSNLSMMNAAFAAQPGWQQAWLVEAAA